MLLQPKAGRDESDVLVKKLFGKALLVDLTPVSKTWMGQSWITGFSPTYTKVEATPNSSAMLRIMSMGVMNVWLVDVVDLGKHFAASHVGGSEPVEASMPKLINHFTTLTADQKGKLKVYKAVSQLMQCLFVPVGYLMADASGAGVMHYGIRKSFFPVSASGPGRYKAMADALQKGKSDVKRMIEIQELFQKAADMPP